MIKSTIATPLRYIAELICPTKKDHTPLPVTVREELSLDEDFSDELPGNTLESLRRARILFGDDTLCIRVNRRGLVSISISPIKNITTPLEYNYEGKDYTLWDEMSPMGIIFAEDVDVKAEELRRMAISSYEYSVIGCIASEKRARNKNKS